MLIHSPVWHGRLRAVRCLTNLLMQTLVIHPALLFFLLFLLMSHGSGGSGQMLLSEAERLVRDAPAGQVWDCRSPDVKDDVSRQAPSLPPQPETTGHIRVSPANVVAPCVNVAVSREDWVSDANHILLSFYKAGVLLSVAAAVAVRIFRRRTH